MLTMTDIINAKLSLAGSMSESELIKYILNEDALSAKKKRMFEGARYYATEHDSLNKAYDESVIEEVEEVDGEENTRRRKLKNPNRSNHHNINTFHTNLVDQKTAYIAGKEPTFTVKGAADGGELKTYEDFVTETADEEFNVMLQDWITGASNKGAECVHVYYDQDFNLKYCIVPMEEIIPIYDSAFQQELVELIRYYTMTVIKGGEKYLRRRVEWWTKDKVTYYIEKEKDVFIPDPDVPVNPAPHFWDVSFLNGAEKSRLPNSWGRIPFIILENNSLGTTDLQLNKGLIDAYDMISSEGTNTLLDLVDLYWVIQGYGGETASAIARLLQINKAVSINDAGGNIAAHQVDLSLTGRIELLKMLRRDIYHFGMGVDFDNDTLGAAPSGVSLKFRYSGLRLKAGKMAPRLKQAIKELFWFLTYDYNRRNNTAFDSELIAVNLNYSEITNDLEQVQIIAQSQGVLSERTLIENHPFVTDVNEELDRIEEEEKQREKKMDERMNANYFGTGEGEDNAESGDNNAE